MNEELFQTHDSLTFDDLLIVPGYSEVLPAQVDIRATLVRGIELSNAPFPSSLEQAVALGRLHGERTYGWLPARGSVKTAFRMALLPVDRRVKGVSDIRATPGGLAVDFMV